jgi:hypothetical protein
LEEDGVGGLVALENLGLEESRVGSLLAELLTDGVLGLAESESPTVEEARARSAVVHMIVYGKNEGKEDSLGLSEEVGKEDLVVLAARDGVLFQREQGYPG